MVTTASCKAKGRKLQQEIVRSLRAHYQMDQGIDSCYEGDIQSIPMGMSTQDIRLSPAAQKLIPFNIEAKFQERLNIWDALKQSESNAGDRTPLLVFRRSRSQTYACLRFDDLLRLVRDDF